MMYRINAFVKKMIAFSYCFICFILIHCVSSYDTSDYKPNDQQCSTKIREGINLSCDGLFDEAELVFASELDSNVYSDVSAALHSLGNIAAIKGNLLLSGLYHVKAKQKDPNSQPPLGKKYLMKYCAYCMCLMKLHNM